ncbi:MAG: UDP-N-acetylmuramoyl-L-alanyl-D-glutamate--2,6-diaminopimelate ligase [Phycisphaerales bacterium]
MRLRELIDGLDVRPVTPDCLDVRICDLTEDSRTALPGSLFVARRGTRDRGSDFVMEAIEAGAVAVLADERDEALELPDGIALIVAADPALAAASIAERFFGYPSHSLTCIGVTGTNGKTTVAHLTHQILNAARLPCGMIGTVWIDDGVEIARSTLTTPPAIELSHALANMVEAERRCVVLEASSHALEQGRLAAIAFDIAIFTNLSGDHLDYHKTLDAYASAKRRLFESLGPSGVAIVNIDDPASETMLSCDPPRVLRCSMAGGPDADCRATVHGESITGADATFEGSWGSFRVRLPLIGRHNVFNALQAVAAAHEAGAHLKSIRSALSKAKPAPGRLEHVNRAPAEAEGVAVLVDYAHTDDALRCALSALAPLKRGSRSRLHVVFGCGGDRDRSKRPRMMAAAAALADVVTVTNDNPRTESPAAIIRDVLGGLPDDASDRIRIQPDRRRAIFDAVADAQAGDIILIAGKGHETEQLTSDGRGGIRSTPLDDRLVAHEALVERFGAGETSARGVADAGEEE